MKYQLQGFQTLSTDNGCDAEREADTIKDARKQARYMLSDAYRRASEAADKICIVQIWRGKTLIDEMCS